ncbi:MAG: aspartate kinase [Anaerovoracaceae bacterium]|jgi:aspartate kinase
MGVKVAKFGGSSVADGIQLAKTKEIIEKDPERKYIVVSAPGKRYDGDSKITDLLYLCKTHIEHNFPFEQVLQVVCDRFTAVIVGLGLDLDLTEHYSKIRRKLVEGASEDYIVSRGEFLNAIIMAKFLGVDFVDTAGLILFDENGKFMEEETNQALAEELSKHERAVLPGFYGTLPNKKIKIFSRGGSDITGSLVARAVGADVYENWTDVSGLLVADPRIVKSEPIERLSYKELRELSYMGAAVLHEDAIYPARIANIPINIRNTNQPEDPGTMITSEEEAHPSRIITGIAGSKDFTVIAIYKNMMAAEKGFIRRVLSIIEDYDILTEHCPTGIDNLSVVINTKAAEGKIDDIVAEIKRKLEPDTVDVFHDIALIATVGCGMSQRPGVSAKLFTALADAGVNIRMIDQGSSEMNIIVGVSNRDFEKAIRAIYQAFIEEEASPLANEVGA